jgi:zinc transporter
MRERALLVQEELAGIRADAMNKHMLLLADVTAIFLPLGLLTGIFGMNVGGLPFTDSWYGFLLIMVFMSVCAVILWTILKRRRVIGK